MIITKNTVKTVIFILLFCGGCVAAAFYGDENGSKPVRTRPNNEFDFGPYPGG